MGQGLLRKGCTIGVLMVSVIRPILFLISTNALTPSGANGLLLPVGLLQECEIEKGKRKSTRVLDANPSGLTVS